MRIERLIVHHVGPFDDLDITFPPCEAPDKAEIHMFVGVNGSGKSTLLYALATQGTSVRHGSPLASRMHEDGSSVDLYADGRRITEFRKHGGRFEPFDTPAFAYSGGRTLESHPLRAIEDPGGNPHDNALSFHRTAQSATLLQWIANTRAKEAFALARGDSALAARRGRAIAAIEQAVSDMVEKDIRFVVHEEPLAVRIRQNQVELSIDALPDGLKSILGWLADLLMRLDRLPARDDVDILHRSFVLFLDEIDVHMHPAWQRKVLPAAQKLFPRAQIFLSTHSPFVVGSVSDAWIHLLTVRDGVATCGEPLPSRAGESVPAILDELFGVSEWDVDTEKLFDEFHEHKRRRLAGDTSAQAGLERLADVLRKRSPEASDIVEHEMRQLARRLGAEKAS